ncbi:MAG: Mur ligase family protein, partial [Tumebacillaceae bacterium]
VTGTCGKTTTKEMIKQILSAKHRVQATVRSKNAGRFHLGYLLGIDANTDVAVFETGVSKRGDLLEACDYYRPTVGVITNIGIDHLNAFHTQEAYIRAKEELLAGLADQGTMVINGDDPNIATFDWSRYKGRVLTFGLGQLADFRAEEIRVADGGMAFTLRYQHMAHRLFVPGYGKHNVYNALAAIAAAYAIGVGIAEAGEALRSYHHLQGHMNVLPGVKGSVVIDDTWNSNPTSMETALQVLCDLAGGRKKIAVLGRMAALGDAADEQYEKIGKRLVECGVDVLITKGSIAKDFAKHAIKHGMHETQVFPCYEVEEIVDCLKRVVDQDSIVLMKASMNDTQMGDLLQSILLSE